MKRLLLAVLLATLCAGISSAETLRERYWRLHRERNATTRYGTPPRASVTNGLPAGCTLLEYVEFNEHQFVDTGYVFTPRDKIEVDWQFTNVSAKQQRVFSQRANPGLHIELYINGSGVHGWAYERDNLTGWKANNRAVSTNRVVYSLDGPNKRMYAGTASWAVSDLSAMTDAECGEGHMFISRNLSQYQLYARCFGCKFWKSGVLVRDYLPVKDSSGVAGLWDRVSGEIHYSATATPLVAGPERLPPAVSMPPEDIAAWFAPPPGSGEVADGDLWLDCLAIPEGNWLCECPIEGSTNTAWRAALCPSNILAAVVWRHAVGLAPTNLPVTIAHDPTRTIGRIERLYYEQGTGIVARLRVRSAGYAEAISNRCDNLSPDLRCFTTGTNVAIRTDGWVHEHQTYIDERLVPRGDADYSAVTNVPASIQAVVMAPIFLKGISFVQVPLLPTYVEQIVPASVTNAYPLRPPRPWHW